MQVYTFCQKLNINITLNNIALVFFGKVFTVGVAPEVASVMKHQELPPCLTEPIKAVSEINLLLSKAEPISSAGGTSVRPHF